MGNDDIEAVAALGDRTRGRLYRFVRRSRRAVTRDEAAADVGISRKLAAFHLDRLVRTGLLEATFERPVDESAAPGRAPKRYKVSGAEIAVSIPDRRYDFVGEILVDAVTAAGPGEAVAAAAERTAADRGRALGAELRAETMPGRLGPERSLVLATAYLSEAGFEPEAAAGEVRLHNCPFHALAQRAPQLVCGINAAFLGGFLEGLEARRVHADLDPGAERCCVILRADPA
ncbi:MAG TPA: transcriptional regulator [Acidimicrobiia bacterium]|nr:transcriptional regulator [Acidimicrobiia bacterium]